MAKFANFWQNMQVKAGKMRMRQFGKVEIPEEAFIAALKMSDE
ncbi:MAG: hypothetical protein WC048_06210 [Rhizobium sp.]